jgi:hypothetical protein
LLIDNRKELKNVYKEGFLDYMMNMWNLADVFRYMILLNYSIHPSETAKNISNIKLNRQTSV